MKHALRLSVLFALSAALSIVRAGDFELAGQVQRVIDGDSLIMEMRGIRYRIELADIDAPELNQPWGSQAADALQRSLTGRFVVITASRLGANGVVVGTPLVGRRDVALDLIYAGLAWTTLPAPDTDDEFVHPYITAERDARWLGRGLWSDPNPMSPWQWRRQIGSRTDWPQ